MTRTRDDHATLRMYKVVRNHEAQYSIWPLERPNPVGWDDAEKTGTKSDCLAFIREAWVEMRPLSLVGSSD